MATIKSYTDIEQSKVLAEILPLESADMFHFIHEVDTVGFGYKKDAEEFYSKTEFEYIPCWSLAALLEILSKYAEHTNESGIAELSYEKVTKWGVSILNCGKIKDCYANNPIDAAYGMIIRLNELNLL